MHEWLSDFRVAARALRRTPVFSVSVVLTFALVIGANTAIFSIVNSMLFQPLPLHDPGRLVRLTAKSSAYEAISSFPWSYPDFSDYRRAVRPVFSATTLFAPQAFNLRHDGEVQSVRTAVVSGSFFRVMGMRPLLGRTLSAADDARTAAARNVVIGRRFWQREFASDKAIIGKQIMLNKKPFTVVGVVDGGRVFNAFGRPVLFMSVQAAAAIMNGNSLSARGARWIQAVYARLKPGASIAEAQKFLNLESKRLAQAYPEKDGKFGLHFTAAQVGSYAGLLIHDRATIVGIARLIWLAAFLILCIACANILNLFLARGIGRLRETAIRRVLGASRPRLARQLLAESTILCAAGGTGGFLLGWVALAFARRFPAIAAVQPAFDLRILGYAAALSVVSALLFGLAPIAVTATRNLMRYLNVAHPTATRSHRRLRHVLSIGQIALSVALLVGTGLMLHSLMALQTVGLGFNPNRIVVAGMDFTSVTGGYFKPPPQAALAELRDNIDRLPGVSGVAFANKTPLDGVSMQADVTVPGFHSSSGVKPAAYYATVGADFFETLGARMLRGSGFSANVAAPENGVLINQAMAERYWHGQNPVGRSFSVNQKTLRVVGVVSNLHESDPSTSPAPYFYYRYPRASAAFVQMIVRTSGAPTAKLRHEIAATVHRSLPGLPAVRVESMRSRLDGMLTPRTNILWALGVFGLIALLITAVGIFAVIAYNVAARYREFSLRMALGARPGAIRRLVLWQVLRFAGIGVIAGFLLSLLAGRLLGGYLFTVSPLDPSSYVLVAFAVLVAALLAAAGPAWRASRLSPSQVLHDR